MNLTGSLGDEDVAFGSFNSKNSRVTPSLSFIAGNDQTLKIDVVGENGKKIADATVNDLSIKFYYKNAEI